MTDWSKDLSAALDSGDAERMRAMLSRVPREAMRQIVPALEHMAQTSEREGRMEEALFHRDRLVDALPAAAAMSSRQWRSALRHVCWGGLTFMAQRWVAAGFDA